MSVDERMVHDLVQKVMANMQITSEVVGMHGVFKDMNDAINASIEAQKKVHALTLDQREKIISCIRKKVRENAELLANMGVNETGMGNVGDKILKHQLTADKTPGTEDITTIAGGTNELLFKNSMDDKFYLLDVDDIGTGNIELVEVEMPKVKKSKSNK